MYERLERWVQLPATRICAPFVAGGFLMLAALGNDAPRALQAGGIVALLAAFVLVRDAGGFTVADANDAPSADLHRHLLSAALHAALFAMSFLMASLGMAAVLPPAA